MDIGTVVDEYIDPKELESFRKNYETQINRGAPSAVAQFCYAHALIKSCKEDVKAGVLMLENLLKQDSEDIPRRDNVYYLALAYTRLKEYDRALQYVNLLLYTKDYNRQASDLEELIRKRMKKEGLMGLLFLGFGGGIAAIAGAIAVKKLIRH